ncbi:MAG: DUF4363 family protein [Clostridiales bacterium]|nr:DUF4363 family protein [Clostridiales bacterium]
MKKFIMSMVILVIILTFSVAIIIYFKNTSNQLSSSVQKTMKFVSEGKWNEAETSIDDLEGKWDKTEKIWATLTDHIEMDNIELSMKKSKQYINTKDVPLAHAELNSLRFMVEHIYGKEIFNLKNIL